MWCGVVRVVCGGVVWCGVVCVMEWCGVVWGGVEWCGVVWCGVVWSGVEWCGVEWCGVEWCGVVWCGVVWSGVRTGHDLSRCAHGGGHRVDGRRARLRAGGRRHPALRRRLRTEHTHATRTHTHTQTHTSTHTHTHTKTHTHTSTHARTHMPYIHTRTLTLTRACARTRQTYIHTHTYVVCRHKHTQQTGKHTRLFADPRLNAQQHSTRLNAIISREESGASLTRPAFRWGELTCGCRWPPKSRSSVACKVMGGEM